MFNSPRKQFSKIYDQCIDKIYRFIFLKVSSQEIAEDLTSEVFSRGWEAFQKNTQEIKNPNAFLYQIARNLIVDFYRQKGAANTVSTDACQELCDPNVNLEEQVFVRSDIQLARTALSRIKEDHQNIIIWYYLDELSVPEIATMTDKPEGTVRVIIHRALKELRKEIKRRPRKA